MVGFNLSAFFFGFWILDFACLLACLLGRGERRLWLWLLGWRVGIGLVGLDGVVLDGVVLIQFPYTYVGVSGSGSEGW